MKPPAGTRDAESPGAFAGRATSPDFADAKPRRYELASEKPARLNPLLCGALYLFAFSLLYEYPARAIPVEINTVTGTLLLLAAFLQPRVALRRPPLAWWCFAGYLAASGILTLWGGTRQFGEGVKLFVQILQVLLICWVSFNLLRFPPVARRTLFSLIAACLILKALQRAGVLPAVDEMGHLYGRLTALGQDPNTHARLLALGTVSLLYLGFFDPARRWWTGVGAVPVLLLLGAGVIATQSRSGQLALGAGLVAFLFARGGFWIRSRNVLLVLLAVGTALGLMLRFGSGVQRFETALATGKMDKRELIYPTAWELFQERALAGWGPIENRYEIGARLPSVHLTKSDSRAIDTHNLLLETLTATGLLGTIPFVLGLLLCFFAAWKARDGPWGILPLSLLLVILTSNMGVNYIAAKADWLVFGFVLAAGRTPSRGSKRPEELPL